ncbi:cycle-inhibiting factor [Paraburkholderia xenovorans]|uniref:cycle-inhibiting factor n=1 Tax=Paraburkholderia xenovorans TaxID=36873 RepID=UPI0038B8F537
MESTAGADFSSILDGLDLDKNYIFLINHAPLGHKFVYELHAGSTKNGRRAGYIFQSDLGSGAMPALHVYEWLQKGALRMIDVDEMGALLAIGASNAPTEADNLLIRQVLINHGESGEIDLSKIRSDKRTTFVHKEYMPENLHRNVAFLVNEMKGWGGEAKPLDGGIRTEWAVATDLPDGGVKINPSDYESRKWNDIAGSGNLKLYIEKDGFYFRVMWDEINDRLRILNPRASMLNAFERSVRVRNGSWILN